MIRNEREYRITKAQADKFARTLAELGQSEDQDMVNKPFAQIQRDAVRSQLDDLNAQLVEYDALKSGQYKILELSSFGELANAFIKARIAAGLSQKDLADKLGLKEQQIQRYEATSYESASLSRLKEIIQALNLQIQEDIFLPSAQVSVRKLLDRLIEAGLDHELIVRRLFPPELVARLQRGDEYSEELTTLAFKTANIVGMVFGWTPKAIFGDAPLTLRTDLAGVTRYKVIAQGNETYLGLYTSYAFSLAKLALKATEHLSQKPVSTDPEEVRMVIENLYGDLSFENILSYIWSLGIPVLPLNDPGAFHGACWREQGRNIIVLKQQSTSLDQALFNLLHELYHGGQDPEREQFAMLESGDSLKDRWSDNEEVSASQFAVDVTLKNRAEALVDLCVAEAKGRVERLKAVVPKIAEEQGVSTGILASYLAFRLSGQNINWWGAATNLQETTQSPLDIARRMFLEKININRLAHTEQTVLLQALSDVH